MSYETTVISDDLINIRGDGRGMITTQFDVRRCFFLPEECSRQRPELFPYIPDTLYTEMNVDLVDVENMSPIVAQILSRLPGRNVKYKDNLDIARGTGLLVPRYTVSGLDHGTVFKNGIYDDWVSPQLNTTDCWVRQSATRFHPDVTESKYATRRKWWITHLRGLEGYKKYKARPVKNLGNTIRDRLSLQLKMLMLQRVQPRIAITEDDDNNAKRALKILSNATCNSSDGEDQCFLEKLKNLLRHG